MKKQTLEEAAERFLIKGAKEFKTAKQVLIAFAKEQQQRMYSEEELREAIHESRMQDDKDEDYIFEQFKKKK